MSRGNNNGLLIGGGIVAAIFLLMKGTGFSFGGGGQGSEVGPSGRSGRKVIKLRSDGIYAEDGSKIPDDRPKMREHLGNVAEVELHTAGDVPMHWVTNLKAWLETMHIKVFVQESTATGS